MKKNLGLIVLTTALCVVIWVLFAVAGMTLDSRDTSFVVAVCLLVVFGIRSLWSVLRRKLARKASRPHLWIGIAWAGGGLMATQRSDSQSTPELPNADPGVVACSPAEPVGHPGEAMGLRAWTLLPPDKKATYAWTVDAGTIEGAGREVRWLLTHVQPGIHTMKVRITMPGTAARTCDARLIVQPGDIALRGGHRASGRAWLLTGQVEDTRYGLRSYILLGRPPSGDEQRERYLRVLEEYLRFPSAGLLEKYYLDAGLPLDSLNIAYLPLNSEPDESRVTNLDSPDSYRAAAEDLLRRYDYERAQTILSGLQGEYLQGPYVVAFPGGSNPLDRAYILQDQSWVPPELVTLWMREFLNQAAQEHDWSKAKSASFVLKMRTIITVGSGALEIVQKELKRLIVYYDGG